MHLKLRVLALFGFLCLSVGLSAQGGLFEDTWQEFLKETKTSSVSKLPEPAKENVSDYLKYSLMYATSHYCADELTEAQKFMEEIRKIGSSKYQAIPGFEARYTDLQAKIEVYHKMSGIWKSFTTSGSAAAFKAEDMDLARKVCERGTLAKYYYLTSRQAYCKGDIDEARSNFNKVATLEKSGGLDVKRVPELAKEMATTRRLFDGLDKLDPVWKKFVSTDKSDGFEEELPLIACYPVPTIKVYLLRAGVDPCKYGSEMLRKIDALRKDYREALPNDVQAKLDKLREEVGENEAQISAINQTWKEFLPTEKLRKPLGDEKYDFPCDRAAEIKAYIMTGLTERCTKGKDMVKNIDESMQANKPQLDAQTQEKLKKLKDLVKKDEEDLANLNKAWAEFTPEDTLKSGIKFPYEYCDKLAQVRAHVITGVSEYCTKGDEMLAGAEKTLKEFKVELDAATEQRLDKLKRLVETKNKDLAALNALWKEFLPKDTLEREFTTADFYCDKMAQVKSWTMKGHVKACEEGQEYVNMINAFQKKHNLKFDRELDCAVTRLRQKVWDCRYWELVRRAWKETHEEREAFGPTAAKLMEADLNTKKMPCPTTVLYEPLGKIGIKYTITTFLCSNIDLAKMGDPDYYKKIATWVDGQVLAKYCLANMRCKEDFFIHIEGHADGNPFPGATYKENFNIPAGTKFTHITEKDSVQRTLEKPITTRLANNMELALARAWTIKNQLDFMKVPITVGAYEHPASRKGGEYRRMETELNMTNLLLDFYEKRLAELLKESGIGERPKECR